MTHRWAREIIGSHPVMQGAPERLVSDLSTRSITRRVHAGQLLCGASEPTGHVWFVGGGLLHATVATRSGAPVTVDVYRRGEAFGYLGCWLEGPHSEDVSGLTLTSVVGVPSGMFLDFVRHHRPAAELLLHETAGRMRALIRLRAIATEPARLRVRSVLSFLCDKMGPRIPMTRAMIATVAGLTTETVNRSMAPLGRGRIVALRRGVVEILDRRRLEGRA